MSPATFELLPVSPWTSVFLAGITVLCLALTLLTGSLALTASRLSVTVEGSELRFQAPFYARNIPVSELRLDAARVVSTVKPSPFSPAWRRNGVGLPGYRLGWYKLRNGDKALLMLTSGDQALHVPSTRDYALLLGVRDPEALLEALRRGCHS